MYKLTDSEATELGLFLRTLCRMNMLDEAKRISKMPDGHLSILIQSEKLWEAADGPQITQEKTAPARPPIDFSRPLSQPADRKVP